MRRRRLTALLLLTAALSGCGSVESTEESSDRTQAETEAESGDDTEADAGAEGSTEAGAGNAGAESVGDVDTAEEGEKGSEDNAAGGQQDIIAGELCQGSLFLEDAQAFYICGTERVRRIKKDGSGSEVLWERGEDAREGLWYMEGKGVLLGDYIYFLEETQGEADGVYGLYGRCLSVVKTDGRDYRRLTELDSFPSTFYYCDEKLYLEGDGYVRYYPVTADGTPGDGQGLIKEIGFEGLPEDYHLAFVAHNGNSYLGLIESLNIFGYYLCENEDFELTAFWPEAGKEMQPTEPLMPEGSLRSFNRDYLLFSKYGEKQTELYLMDAHSLDDRMEDGALAEGESIATSLLAVYEDEDYSSITVLDMDEDYVYVVARDAREEPEKNNVYEKIDIKTGERRELFRLGRRLGIEGSYSSYARLQDGYAYYADEKDYKMYLMRRSLEEPETVEIIGDALYDSGISQVGTVESYYEQIRSTAKPDFVLTEIDLERLVVDEKYEGAAKINAVLTAYQNNILSYEKDQEDIDWREREVASSEEGDIPYSLSYSYSSYPSEITYFDGDRFSFCQRDYDYTGGAHGMPAWIGFTFDLHTGEQLFLPDLIGESEEALKDIVVRYFDAYMSENPENFWEDALTTVRENTNFSSDFYLTEDGICFYFSPYALSSYAAGFQQVVIPYEEFDRKVPLDD